MSAGRLKKLTITHLRGSVCCFSLPFEKGKSLTVVYGENGTGKTAICDGLEFLGKGTVGSLENRGLGKTERYWQSLGRNASDVSVSLETSEGSCTGTIQKGVVVALPGEQRPRVELLRRSDILHLVEARPGDRYEAIRRFIDVSGVEACEGTLRELTKTVIRERDEALARVHENRLAIEHFWNEAGQPAPGAMDWAKKQASQDVAALQQQADTVDSLRSAFDGAVDLSERLDSASSALASATEAGEIAEKALAEAVAVVSEGAADVVAVLEAATHFLNRHPDPGICPLCESSTAAPGLAIRVAARLHEFGSLRQAKEASAANRQSIIDAHARLADLEQDATKRCAKIRVIVDSASQIPDLVLPSSQCPEKIAEMATWVAANRDLVPGWIDAAGRRQDATKFLNTLKRALDLYDRNLLEHDEIECLRPRLQRALEIIVQERQKFTDSVLSKISAAVGELYELVHPGEGLNKIALELDPDKRSSLELSACFCGHSGTPPQAYFSQSHLDTLGLCVFLALAALEHQEQTILVLDDVLASIDEPHVERLIEMLYTQASKFRHCLITTHYRPWREKLRWGWLKNGQCQFVELSKWTTAGGICTVGSVPETERLRALLSAAPPDPQLVCAKAGVILEAALDFLTQLYECKVPRRPGGRYTLGDLLQAIDKRLRETLAVDVLASAAPGASPSYTTTPLKGILEELTRIAQARNVFGCHFNDLSFEMLDQDASTFGQQVLSLMDLLVDEQTGWPRSQKSGSYWATSGETRRLHPLKQPA
jgi:recombinational DNA repair ATPase RecF